MMQQVLIEGDALASLRQMPPASVDCCVTSPPYWGLRDYGSTGQIGLEATPREWVVALVAVFAEVKRVLKRTGTLWLNVGDSYVTLPGQVGERSDFGHGRNRLTKRFVPGLKRKDLIGLPWLLAFALREDGWYLRSDIIWHKRNAKPESAPDRPTRAHEYIFLLTCNADYYYDRLAVAEPQVASERTRRLREAASGHERVYTLKRDQLRGQPPAGVSGCFRSAQARQTLALQGTRNKRTIWDIPTRPGAGNHFAAYPEGLAVSCILAGTSELGVCAACGEPWRRLVNRAAQGDLHPDRALRARGVSRLDKRGHHQPMTLGWERGCGCILFEQPIPATVLDPFAGTGTTLKAAQSLGRGYVGIELNPEYAAIARHRLHATGVATA